MKQWYAIRAVRRRPGGSHPDLCMVNYVCTANWRAAVEKCKSMGNEDVTALPVILPKLSVAAYNASDPITPLLPYTPFQVYRVIYGQSSMVVIAPSSDAAKVCAGRHEIILALPLPEDLRVEICTD